ncbi:hypothetical protein Poly30_28760 [Planctomycetes bacterium Poly30]|uniref:Uncharacterized protein n=1 Tax=Saltatorellus ferox TaxID=2528018 RepID=A0A518ETF4_9BACT|nr:hypothetical protein Poly30_28760 [Planctomycetes bacterium Poly30]
MVLAIGAIERCLETLGAVVRSDEVLSEEFSSSIGFFFRGPAPLHGEQGIGATLLAARRHLEWFLMEYHSPTLRGSMLDRLAEGYADRVAEARNQEGPEIADAMEQALDALLRSHAGIFEIEEVRKGAGAWMRDLTGFGSFALGDVAVAEILNGGELVVGRLYPAGEGVHLASPAAAILASKDVTKALRRDLDQIRETGANKIVRVSQGELEAMFFGAGQRRVVGATAVGSGLEASADPVGDAHARLVAAGLGEARARAAVSQLAREPRDPDSLVHGASDVLGAILEELAFDTDIDLGDARTALLEAWELVSMPFEGKGPTRAKAASAPAPKRDVYDEEEIEPDDELDEEQRAAALAAFTAGRALGTDPAQLLQALESELGIDDDQLPPDEKEDPAPDFPGVVGAMIEEMKWELGATDPDADIEALAPLEHLAEFAKPIGVFEELRGRDMFRFATFWLQEKEVLTSDAEAVALVGALRTFCNWALDAHEVDLGSEFLYALDGMEFSLPRMRHANMRVPEADRARGIAESGELYEILELEGPEPGAFETSHDKVRASNGDVLTVIVASPLRDALAPGDRVRGEITLDGRARIYRCYPPEAKALAAG